MSDKKLNKFLNALDAVLQDYTCGVCLELCKEPVTLSTCFHIICSQHFKDLKTCPTCNIPLSGCTTYTDKRLEASVNSAKELGIMFESFRTTSVLQDSKVESSNGTSKKRGKKELPQSNTEVSEKVTEKTTKTHKNISEKSNKAKKLESKTDLNSTLLSSASSRINKGNEKRNNKGETALHVACRLGKVDTVIDLLKQGANTNTKDNAGWTPLHEVVQNGRLDLVKLLLQYNTLIDVPGQSNETPLHEAVRYNHTDIAEELVKNGANIKAKNCKGETPLQLANNNMKKVLEDAADNVVQTQGLNVTLISELHIELDSDDIRIYCASQFKTVNNKIKLLTKHFPNLHIEAKFTKKVTHLVVDTDDGICTSSLDILQGIVYGLWIISSEWITKSTETHLEPFQDHEVLGVGNKSYNGPKNARYNKYKQLPGIFNGCHFYLHNFGTQYEISKTIVLTKTILTKLINDAGGIVLRRVPNPELIPDAEKLIPYHAKKGGKLEICSHYIIFKDIYEPMYNMSHFKALPIGWLIECLEKYELCEPW